MRSSLERALPTVQRVCTVVCRWAPEAAFPVQLLALRDELLSRAFDLPAAWWPDQPTVVGGRDRLAGGSWCVSDIATGVTGVVLNRPDRPVAAAGAPSRGILPLQAVKYQEKWPSALDVHGMASFNLVIAAAHSLRWWLFDGERVEGHELAPGTYMFTPRGLSPAADLDPRFANSDGSFLDDETVPAEDAWAPWLSVLRGSVRDDDPSAMLVRRPEGEDSFETVFGQLIAARPETLRLDYSTAPDSAEPWTTRHWHHDPVRGA